MINRRLIARLISAVESQSLFSSIVASLLSWRRFATSPGLRKRLGWRANSHNSEPITMHPLVNIALRAANDAGDALAHKIDRLDRIKVLDSDPQSFMTSADHDGDKTLLYHIQKAHPTHSILSRVSGLHEGEEGSPLWLIDPLVGNKNFAHGYTRFGVSIAIRKGDVTEHAVLVSPMQREEFTASRGKGAQLNNHRIRVDAKADIDQALLGLNEQALDPAQFSAFQMALFEAGANPRMSGCNALDLADAACGRLLGGWFRKQNEPSIAAAAMILLESGGYIGSENGNPHLGAESELIFGNAKTFKELV